MRMVWDVIVIGAGVGGLTAASYLVKEGLRVLVLDRNPHIGGTAYVYHRQGFTFPMGPLGFSHPDLVKKVFDELGIGEGLNFLRVHYRLRAFGLDGPLSLPFSEIAKEFKNQFPSDAEGVERFFRDIKKWISNRKVYPENQKPNSNLPLSASEYLRKLIKDWRLRRILGSLGTREPYSNLPLLAAMWNLMCNVGIWFPEEGMKSFCGRLKRAIEPIPNSDRMIRLNKGVTKIRVKHGKVEGVTLRDGNEIDASCVISNADYRTTFLKLLDPHTIPSEWFQAISNAPLTSSIFQVCLGIDPTKIDLSLFKEASRVIYRRKFDLDREEEKIDWTQPRIDPRALACQEIEVSLWENRMEKERKASIILRVEANYDHFARYRLGWRKRSQEYQNYKIQLAQGIVREVAHLMPGLENSILIMDVATPLTFEDQGGRSQGAVAGWSWNYEDFRDDEPKELILTPIKGLYMTGYQAFSALFMGGIPTALESGRRAAQALISGKGPTQKIQIPGGPYGET